MRLSSSRRMPWLQATGCKSIGRVGDAGSSQQALRCSTGGEAGGGRAYQAGVPAHQLTRPSRREQTTARSTLPASSKKARSLLEASCRTCTDMEGRMVGRCCRPLSASAAGGSSGTRCLGLQLLHVHAQACSAFSSPHLLGGGHPHKSLGRFISSADG